MKRLLILGVLASLSAAAAQSPYRRVIYGTAITQDGTPAKGLMLNAQPLGVVLGMALPSTKTNDTGAFRCEHLQWGRYTVFAEDKAFFAFSLWASARNGQPGPLRSRHAT